MEYAKIIWGDHMDFVWWTWIWAAAVVLAGLFFVVMLIVWLTMKPVKAELLRYDGRWFPVAVYRIGESEFRNIFPTSIKQTVYFPAGITRTVRKSRLFGFVIDRNALASIIMGAAVFILIAVLMIIDILQR